MSDVIGTLRAVLTAETAKFDAAMASSSKVVENFDSTLQGIVSGVTKFAGALGIGVGLGAVVNFGKEALNTAGRLADLSDKTGLSTRALQIYGAAAKLSGSDVEDFADATFKLGINIDKITKDTDPLAQSLAKLGLGWREIQQLAPEEQMNRVMEALHGVENTQERNRIGVELYGKRWAQIAPAVVAGLKDIEAQTVIAGDAQIKAADRAGDAWDRFWSNQKSAVVNAVGNWAIAKEQVDKLTDSQRNMWQAIVKSGGDGHKFLLDLAKAEEDAAKAAKAHAEEIEKTERRFHSWRAAGLKAMEVTKEEKEEREKAAAAAKKHNDEIQRGADILTGRRVAAEMSLLAESVRRAQQEGGILASEWPKLVAQVERLRLAGVPLPKVLNDIVTPIRTLASLGPVLTADIAALTAGMQTAEVKSALWSNAADDLYESMGRAMEITDQTALQTIEFAGAVSDAVPAVVALGDANVQAADDSAHAWQIAAGIATGIFSEIGSSASGASAVVARVMAEMTRAMTQAFGPEGFSGSDLAGGVATLGVSLAIDAERLMAGRAKRREELIRLIREMGEEPVAEGKGKDARNWRDRLEEQYRNLTEAANQATQAALNHAQAIQDESDAVDRVRQLTEQYGISFDGLGQKITEADLAQKAMDLADAWDFLVNERFADSQTVLEGMSDEAQAFIDRAMALGITLPESMRPMIEKMIEFGLLTDENGEKLEDISKIKFAKSIEEGIGDVTDALLGLPDKMVDAFKEAFGGIGTQATNLADDLHKKLGNVKIRGSFDFAPPAVTEKFPSFADRPLERVTGAGLAMLHPGDVVGVPQGGSLATIERLLMRQSAELPIMIRSAMQLA